MMTSISQKKTFWERNCGAIYSVLSSLVLASTGVFVKKITSVSKTELAAFRVGGQYLFLLPYVLKNFKLREIFPLHDTWTLRLLVIRGFCGVIGVVTSFYAYEVLPIGDVHTIMFTNTVLGIAGAWLFLGEKLTKKDVFVFVSTLLGTLCVIRPKALLTWDSELIEEEFGISMKQFLFGVGFTVACTITMTANMLIIRTITGHRIDKKSEQPIHWTVINFYFATIGCLVIHPICLIQNERVMQPTSSDIIFMVLTFAGGFAAQIFRVLALTNTSIFKVSVAGTTFLLFGFAFDYLFFNKVPGGLSIIGCVIIVTSVMTSVLQRKT